MKKKITDIWKFLTYDIWRITEDEVTRTKFSLYNIIKTIYLCINRFTKDRMANKASALTYSTLLAIVPILAILFAVARGFGFDNLMEHQFRNGFGGNIETTEAILSFVNSYLSQTKGGIFIGVGLVMLLWTVFNLVSNIEITFNRIWEVKKARSMYRKITDYFSMFLLMPILIVVSGGLSLFMSTILKQMDDFVLLAAVMKFMIRLIPFVLRWMMFTGLYIFMPNTKVKFKHALIAGILMVQFLPLHVSTIGNLYTISNALPTLHLPVFDMKLIQSAIPNAFTIAVLAAIESLLSCVVADGMINSKHRSDTELIAQGAGNIASALFGGIPATGVIARTAANIKNGGRTPTAGSMWTMIPRRWMNICRSCRWKSVYTRSQDRSSLARRMRLSTSW